MPASVDTTMGLIPLDGLVMATRSGSVDPGLITWLQEQEGLGPAEVADALEHRSGLLALSGTADMRELLTRTDDDARLALDVYVHRLAASIGAMMVSLDGLDGLMFTDGVGERSATVRAMAAARLAHLGITVDEQLNTGAEPDVDVTAGGAGVRTLVVRAREDLEITAGAERALQHGAR